MEGERKVHVRLTFTRVMCTGELFLLFLNKRRGLTLASFSPRSTLWNFFFLGGGEILENDGFA